MAYTEVKKFGNKKYYYRVISVRKGSKVSKKRIYLGVDLNSKALQEKEGKADKKLFNAKRAKSKKEVEELKSKIVPILKHYKIKRAGIFGSYATGKQRKKSDVDILVELEKPMGFGFVGIKFDIEDKIKKKVDLLTYNSIHPLLKKRILGEEVRIL